MKKIYQIPEIKIVKIQLPRIMAGSPDAQMYGKNAEGAAMSRQRGGSIWDDEE